MTSIEWFAEMVSKMGYVSADIVEQAKEMHKQETIDFARHCLNKAKDLDVLTAFINTQQYYQETFKNK